MPTTASQPALHRPQDLHDLLRHTGKDPSRLAFEDELTELHNRRFLKSYLEHRVRWDAEDDFPLGLLVLDLDHFKTVNDLHGHAVGDQALGWVAGLLREVAGETGIPVRYAGDEFTLLLPGVGREEAHRTADRLVRLARRHPFRVRGDGLVLSITMSVGAASAPEDATDPRGLFHAADTALYHAKHSGRNQAAHAGGVDPAKVFPKTALQRLQFSRMGGRTRELAAVAEALAGLGPGAGRAVLFDAGAGMGKTSLLHMVRRSLAEPGSPPVVRVAGDPRETERPYYLVQQLIAALFDAHPDGGESVLDDLPAERRRALAAVLPRPAGDDGIGAAPVAPDAILDSVVQVVARAADFGALVVLADDLHQADPPSFEVLSALLARPDLGLLLVATALEAAGDAGDSPFTSFVATVQGQSRLRRTRLEPLAAPDIAEYLEGIFPRLATPPGFVAEIARATRGHPLFLSEIVRKLIADGKVILDNLQWVARPLEPGYLPGSLEEVVLERMKDLDVEGRELLERASAIGETTPLSLLAGSAQTDENRILEAMDRAEDLGLVHFDSDDEILRFPGTQVRDVAYNGIERERRERIHEQIGDYAEGLYERNLLPSAALVAWQFQRSGNREKSQRYERIRAREVRHLAPTDPAEEVVHEEPDAGKPLDPDSVPHVPRVVRAFTKVVRDAQLYPAGSAAVARSRGELRDAIEAVLEKNDRLQLTHQRRALLVNGHRPPLSGAALQAETFLEILSRAELQGVTFLPGVEDAELGLLVDEIVAWKSGAVPPGHWREFQAERGLDRIALEQVRYARVVRRSVPGDGPTVEIAESELGRDDLGRVPGILRAFHGAFTAARLYPLDSPRYGAAVGAFHDALQDLLRERGALTLAWTDDSLIANGVRVDAGLGDGPAAGLVQELRAAGLESVSWTSAVRPSDLAAFVAGLRDADGAGPEYWRDLAREAGLQGIALNARPYSTDVVHDLLEWADAESEELEHHGPARPLEPFDSAQPTAALLERLPAAARELLARGEHDQVGRLVKGLMAGFHDEEPLIRERALRTCRSLLGSLNVGLQRDFSMLTVDSLLESLSHESDPPVLREFGLLLTAMANIGVRFGDYPTASRVLGSLRSRREGLDRAGGPSIAGLLDPPLEPAVQMLLVEVLRSREPDQQAGVARVLGSLGRSAVSPLVEVILSEPDFRVRLMAATLLEEAGWAAAKEIKRALATEASAVQRVHLLEVADRITQDLSDELRSALADPDPRVRTEGFRLFQRLGRDDLIDLVVPYATADDPDVAGTAIESLAALGTAAAVAGLVEVQRASGRADTVIACCRALGQAGSLAGVEALVGVLEERRLRFFGHRWSEPVRAAAAGALAQINHPRAAETLARLTDDPHPWVRDLARGHAPTRPAERS